MRRIPHPFSIPVLELNRAPRDATEMPPLGAGIETRERESEVSNDS
jgi:hypothetical protein